MLILLQDLRSLKVTFFCLPIGGLFYTVSLSKYYYKTNTILITFLLLFWLSHIKLFSLQLLKSNSGFDMLILKESRQKKVSTCILIRFQMFEVFKVSLFCLYIGGLFYIFFTIKILLQTKQNTHILFLCFDWNSYKSISPQSLEAKSDLSQSQNIYLLAWGQKDIAKKSVSKWQGPAQYAPFLYTLSHLSELPSCKSIISTDFP